MSGVQMAPTTPY